jgi:Metallo-peptidase family M12B Reprolysin-like
MRNKHFLSLALVMVLVGCGGGGTTPPPSTPDYFNELSLSLRWSSTKTANPLKVFIGKDGTTDRSTEVMAGATAWSVATSNLVRFTQTDTAGDADITVTFSDTVDTSDGGVGLASVSFAIVPGNPTADGIIQSGAITLKTGIASNIILPTMQHELGHALGIVGRNKGDNGHSSYDGDVMFPVIKTSSGLSSRDAGTLIKLYATSRKH